MPCNKVTGIETERGLGALPLSGCEGGASRVLQGHSLLAIGYKRVEAGSLRQSLI